MRKIQCEICNKLIPANTYKSHQRRHLNHPESFKEPTYKLNHDGLTCQFCGQERKNRNSLCNHERLCKLNPNRQLTTYEKCPNLDKFNTKGKIPWNKGLTKDTDERLRRVSEWNMAYHKEHPEAYMNRHHSEETKKKISNTMINRCKELGTNLCGKGKRGVYHGILCQSSWELAYVIYQEEHNVNFIRNSKPFSYTFESKIRTYFPDFYLCDEDTYIEIKGYYDKKTAEKVKQFTGNLIVLQKKEMQPILEYVITKYGKNFTDLYDVKYFNKQ